MSLRDWPGLDAAPPKANRERPEPGGGSFTIGPHGGDWLLYHGRSGDYSQPRSLRIDPVYWNSSGAVTVRGPTTGPQTPVP
jgi:hypothetical protein